MNRIPGSGVFRLAFEEGFLNTLTERELAAAIAHELGHVWIFTHFPFLQTEDLANSQALKVVSRDDLDQLYAKVAKWKSENSPSTRNEADH